jgi:hypothetical protein
MHFKIGSFAKKLAFLLKMLLVFAKVGSLVFNKTPFFRRKSVQVQSTEKYQPWHLLLFYNATLIECMYSGHRVRLNTEYRGFQSC